jgi:serpin B
MQGPSQFFPAPAVTRRTALKAGGMGLLGLLGMSRLATVLAAAPNAIFSNRADAKADITTVVKGNSEFAFDLYAKLRDKGGNLFFSPESISTALAMTYAGARGATAEQMAKTLHLTLDEKRLHPAFHNLIEELNGAGKKRGYQLSVANALWGQKGFGFLPEFLKLTKTNYGAGLHEVDFRTQLEATRKTINAWVEKETKEKIKELFKSGDLDQSTRLALTNAIYFKGDWDRQFKKDLTRKEAFHLSSDKTIDAMMMHDNAPFKYLDGGAFQALELPYKGKELSMVALLPKALDGLADFEKTLTAAKLAEWLPKMRQQEVIVSLPKFQTTSEFRLNDVLSAMGMPLAFTESADFSGLNGARNLFIGVVVHKAYVDVNEEGTEAAAATGVGIKLSAAPVVAQFRADHPFVFLIRDNRSGSILFLGRVAKPQA